MYNQVINYWAKILSFDDHALAVEDARPEQREEVPSNGPRDVQGALQSQVRAAEHNVTYGQIFNAAGDRYAKTLFVL